eukprot:1144253-Pelagomonas_calceolata.AAC.8
MCLVRNSFIMTHTHAQAQTIKKHTRRWRADNGETVQKEQEICGRQQQATCIKGRSPHSQAIKGHNDDETKKKERTAHSRSDDDDNDDDKKRMRK